MSEQSEKVNRGNAWNKPKVSHRKYIDNLKLDVSKISEKYSKDRESWSIIRMITGNYCPTWVRNTTRIN